MMPMPPSCAMVIGEARLGDGIHGGRYHGQIDADFAGQLAGQRDIAGQDFRICRHQQHVIEGECLFKNTHRVRVHRFV